ncbi:MAG TPA: type IX secretion system protein PorQ [Chitinophagaceae bacterium]|nr:type IX secretion system protein PorQ [Chitinophagaceae bacterium]
MKWALLFISLFSLNSYSQTLGGNSVYNFLKLPNTPQLSSLGGINISQPSDDIGLVFNNPALLKPAMHSQLNAVFNGFYSGIRTYHLSLGYHHEKLKTTFSWGLHYFDYGNTIQTDAAGNILGEFRPVDWVMQVSASRKYMEKWNYGATLKFIHSGYGMYRSSGIAMDIGVLYDDTAHLFSAAVLAKNLGTQIKKYEGTDPDDLPFDLQAGFTKRLANAPFSFSFTAHHLHQYNIRFNDKDFDNENGFEPASGGIDKLFRHFVFATTVYVGDKIEATAGYNYLRRKELNIGQSGNGLNGFSLGLGVLLDKLQIRYARVYYQNNSAYNQFGLNLKLNKYFGLGKFGKKIGW